MRHRFVARVLPGLAVLALLSLAATSPGPLMPAPPPLFTECPQLAQVGGGSLTTLFSQGAGVRQPLPAAITVVACSLQVQATGWSWSQLRVQEWDPLTLAPDPAAIALRSALFDPSAMSYYTTNSMPAVQFVPPVVTTSLAGVAEPPRNTLSVDATSLPSSFLSSLQATYSDNGNPAMPAASLVAADGTQSPLAGTHPVIAHALCTGNTDTQQLRVAQAVRRTDATLPGATQEIAQLFRVPSEVELRWVELACANTTTPTPAGITTQSSAFTTVAIVDGVTLPAPATSMPASLAEATFTPSFYYAPGPRWAAINGFDNTILLLPGHDYWLYVRQVPPYQLLARTLTGGESPTFTAGVGPLYVRGNPTDPWTPLPDRAFAFTLVGVSAPGLGVGAPPLARDGIRLQVAPNPAPAAGEVTWSGGVGPVRLEVLDARGRRVGAGEGGAAGTWRWTGLDGRGGALPSGVYFVHARDTAGEHAVQRMVIVR